MTTDEHIEQLFDIQKRARDELAKRLRAALDRCGCTSGEDPCAKCDADHEYLAELGYA